MNLQVLRALLTSAIDMIDSGNCRLSDDELKSSIDMVSSMIRPKDKLSKYQACNYLNISRAKFDNLVKDNKLPEGKKEQGFKELFWHIEDLNKYKLCK